MENRIIKLPKRNKELDVIGADCINSVLGQLSDGIWENSNRCTGYWICANLNEDLNLEIEPYSYYYDRWNSVKNPYYNMSDYDIVMYFARKIKQVVLIEMAYDYERDVLDLILRNNGVDFRDRYNAKYIDATNKSYEQQKDFLKQNPFSKRGKFSRKYLMENNNRCRYLERGTDMTYLDAFEYYEFLISYAKTLDK